MLIEATTFSTRVCNANRWRTHFARTKISPPSAKVALISGGDLSLIKVHPGGSKFPGSEVTYYASRKSLDQFVRKILIQVPASSQEKQERISFRETITEENSEDILANNDDSAEVEFGDSDSSADETEQTLKRSSSTSSKKYSSNGDEFG